MSRSFIYHLYVFVSYTDADDWHTTRLEVSKIAVLLLVKRSKYIFEQFLINEKHLGAPISFSRIYFLWLQTSS